jgi:hypothetical protein
MITEFCSQTWKHVGVMMSCAVKMLDVGGIGAGNPRLRRLKRSLNLPYGVRIEQIKLQMEALPPIKDTVSSSLTSNG